MSRVAPFMFVTASRKAVERVPRVQCCVDEPSPVLFPEL